MLQSNGHKVGHDSVTGQQQQSFSRSPLNVTGLSAVKSINLLCPPMALAQGDVHSKQSQIFEKDESTLEYIAAELVGLDSCPSLSHWKFLL